jgi:hypothetical protein
MALYWSSSPYHDFPGSQKTMNKNSIYDTTLRDSSQGADISFSLEDKLHAGGITESRLMAEGPRKRKRPACARRFTWLR